MRKTAFGTKPSRKPMRGFTLVELMTAAGVVGILGSIAYPTYTGYVARARLTAAFGELSLFGLRMEQRYSDIGAYGTADCAATPRPVQDFAISCVLTDNAHGFVATARGLGRLQGYAFTIDQAGQRSTLSHPGGVPKGNCWTLRGGSCDA